MQVVLWFPTTHPQRYVMSLKWMENSYLNEKFSHFRCNALCGKYVLSYKSFFSIYVIEFPSSVQCDVVCFSQFMAVYTACHTPFVVSFNRLLMRQYALVRCTNFKIVNDGKKEKNFMKDEFLFKYFFQFRRDSVSFVLKFEIS